MQLRRMGGNHCHLNMVPINKTAAASAQQEFERAAKQEGFSLRHAESGRLANHCAVFDVESALAAGFGRVTKRVVFDHPSPLFPGIDTSPNGFPLTCCSLDKVEELVGANEYFVAYLPDGSILWTEISRSVPCESLHRKKLVLPICPASIP